MIKPDTVQARAYRALMTRDIDAKHELVRQLGHEPLQFGPPMAVKMVPNPGRPDSPRLVAPRELVRRRLGSQAGRMALLHAVAHIEFNAINLALDAVYRFSGMPDAYYEDWVSVALDESRHFAMLAERLAELGGAYGDLPAHNGLWEMAVATSHSALERMALVPRVLEARGLDVSPGMIDRLRQHKDERSAVIIETILEEEVRHVAIGTRWFHFLCEKQSLDPEPTFLGLLDQHMPGRAFGPLNHRARLAAGFDPKELIALEGRG